jgi:hypothetical protein
MSLIDTVLAARKAAEAENTHPDMTARSEAQQAAILIAQVQAIMADAQSPAPPPPAPPPVDIGPLQSAYNAVAARLAALEQQITRFIPSPSAPGPLDDTTENET